MSESQGKISRRQLLKMASPLGKLTLEKSGCTGCGLCAQECPTGSLRAAPGRETGGFQLLFKHTLCVACGQCVEICPEKCLSMERTFSSDSLEKTSEVLFEDDFVRCPECGTLVGSRAMINSIRARLTAAGQPPLQFELCPDCKAKTQFIGLKSQ